MIILFSFLFGIVAGLVMMFIMYLKRPKQKKYKHHFSEAYEVYRPQADTNITNNTRRDHSINDFR